MNEIQILVISNLKIEYLIQTLRFHIPLHFESNLSLRIKLLLITSRSEINHKAESQLNESQNL